MASLPNVVLRGCTYHFRRSIPVDIRDRLGRRELITSLRTSDFRTAKLAACRLYVASENLFVDVRTTPMLTDIQLAALVQDFYSRIIEQDDVARRAGRMISPDARRVRANYFATVATNTRDALACNRLDEAGFLTESTLTNVGIMPSALTPTDLAQAKQAILRAGVDVAEALKARYEGDFNFEPNDKLLKLQLTKLEADHPAPTASCTPVPKTPIGTVPCSSSKRFLSIVGEAFRVSQSPSDKS
ncbi:DUF6538 domain-containing protein [Methylobacterium marchantiae]|uniref:DUF6538 domain-containing protein n=1 Tax=Methylobacterium marchantiae TaxID=600331 RepID=A0ABW3X5M0_9HYPH|nr:hypothetical protein AIGOOFII_4032 [Methylobacterium marchantiae]